MPHLIIESSIPLPQTTVEALHKEVGQQETVSMASVKTRLYTPALSFMGEDLANKHTALTLKLLPGRSFELKEQMAKHLFKKASDLISECSISVEIVDLGVYTK